MAKPKSPTSAAQRALVRRIEQDVRGRTSLERVLKTQAIQDFATGDSLSDKQRGLVAATVAVLQQDVIDCLESEVDLLSNHLALQREQTAEIIKSVTFASVMGIRQAWNMPLVTVSAAGGGDGGDDSGDVGSATGGGSFWRYLTWGNFMSGAAAILLCVALFYTKAYSSYKERAENQKEEIVELKGKLADQDLQLTDLRSTKGNLDKANEELEFWKAKAETLAQKVGSAEATADVQVDSVTAQLAEANANLAQAQEQAKNAQKNADTYESLRKKANANYKSAQARAEKLDSENDKLKMEIESLKDNRP